MTILDYIKNHQDESFKEFSFTEVDNLIFSLLPYVNFTDIVPAFKKNKITIKEANKKIQEKDDKIKGIFISNSYKMLDLMSKTKRYSNIYLYNYMNVVNDEMQFAALTLKLDDNSIYISFAGTDTSIIGWEEDFKMAYMYPGASQKYASIYLNKAISLFDHYIRVGGHSKGGNLAISASMNASKLNRRKIKEIYNNDGPGFLKEQVESKKYKSIEDKIKMYVPKDSIIGMILYHTPDYNVVKSKGFNIIQHDAFKWICNDSEFEKTILTNRSKKIEAKLTKRLESLPIDTRLNLVKNIFNIFRNNDIKDTKNITINNLFKLIKNFTELDKETQNLITELLLILFIK